MQGAVSELGLSKSGKPKVKINGEWYSIKTNQGYGVGSILDFEARDFEFQGKTFHGIERFAVLPHATYPHASLPPQAPQDHWKPPTTFPINAAPSPPPSANVAPAGYTEPERMFISNIIAAAINAGACKSVVDLIPWTNAALYALRHAKADIPSAIDPEVGF